MKLTINQHDLLDGLQRVSGVVPAKSTTPVLENVLIEADEKLKITATDLEVSITTEVAVRQVDEKGAVALPARVITEMVRSLPEIPIQFEADESHKVRITTNQGFYQISGISKENYPEIPTPDGDRAISVENQHLSRMLAKTIFAVSSDELRPALMGVYLQVSGEELRMVATDGHRLSKIVDSGYKSDVDDVKMIVPPKAAQIALKNLTTEGKTRLTMDDAGLSFIFNATTLYTRLVEGQYPDYERVIPRDNDKTMIADRGQLIASVKRVSLFSSHLTRQIRFSLSPGLLVVQSEDIDVGGKARESIDVDYNGEAMEIGFNAQYLMDIIRQVDMDEVAFHFKSRISAALITPVSQQENESFVMLLMPIKLAS